MSAVQELSEHIYRSFKLALEGNGPQWDSYVRSMGLTPLGAEQRSLIRSISSIALKGVLPVEFRVVLEAIRTQVSMQPEASSIAMELDTFVERELLRFIAAAQPSKAALAGIFANAHQSAIRSIGTDTVSALRCRCCGAARLAQSDLRTCTFCGSALL